MQEIPDFEIAVLVVETDRPEHIARHGVTVEEVMNVINSQDYITVGAKEGRVMIIGPSEQARFLAILVGPRAEPGVYGLVTARPAHRSERALYNELTKGGNNG